MKRDDLIFILKLYPENYDIVVSGYEEGYDDINEIKIIKMLKNYNTEKDNNKKQTLYCGKHSDIYEPYWLTDEEKSKAISVIYLNFNLEKDNKKYKGGFND